MRLVSEDNKRALTDEALLGFPAYELNPSDDGMNWNGVHIGIFQRKDDAISWLDTGEPKPTPIPTFR